MFKFISDISTAVKLTSEIRQARKSGDALRVERLKNLPFKRLGYGFLNTMEGCALYNGSRAVYEAVRDVYGLFDPNTQQALCFTPEHPGEWAGRARAWQEALRPTLPPEQYHAAMTKILAWYVKCVKRRLEAAA